jgi:flavin-dependent dehydrogenase
MNNLAKSYDVIIAGAGPAGSSAAIHLANNSFRVLLVEQKKFPRPKLCGEFISPECLKHFEMLGVTDEMLSSSPALLTETVFYSRTGHGLTIPSKWFGGGALGLSRAVMDNNLLQRAADAGVTILEDASVTDLIEDKDGVRGVCLKKGGTEQECNALITIDATGRTRALTRKLKRLRQNVAPRSKAKLIAFKAHLEKTRVADGACEIYFYPGGYGGLSTIEGGVSNLCFIAATNDVRRCQSNPEKVVREIVFRNKRAAHTLEAANVCSKWLSVSLENFGRQRPSPAKGLLAIGDSAAFIDPFTGSGMLMALESGELASQLLVRHLKSASGTFSFAMLADDYSTEYRRKFDSRLRLCGLLRQAACTPFLAEIGIALCGSSERLRNRLARATHSDSKGGRGLPDPAKWI